MVKISALWYYPKNAKKYGKFPSMTMNAYIPDATLQRAKMDAYNLLKGGKVAYSHKAEGKEYYFVKLSYPTKWDEDTYGIVAMYNGKVYYENQKSKSPTVYEIDFLGRNIRKVRNIYKDQ